MSISTYPDIFPINTDIQIETKHCPHSDYSVIPSTMWAIVLCGCDGYMYISVRHYQDVLLIGPQFQYSLNIYIVLLVQYRLNEGRSLHYEYISSACTPDKYSWVNQWELCLDTIWYASA